MVVETVSRVVCDHCGKTGPDCLESEDARDEASKAGWQMYTDDEGPDLCPECRRRGVVEC